MSFNFGNFMNAFAQILPAVGATVEALHPNNQNEALKIELGTKLIQAIAATMNQSATPADPGSGSPAA